MLETKDILETINMIDNENLDVRTITMGISLIDCIDSDIDKACDKIYDKICMYAKDLVKTGDDIAKEYGISPKKSASILDTFSCVFQAVLPYGAQMLVAISAASALGAQISALSIIPKLFYPYLLCVSSLVAIGCTKKQNHDA